MHWFLGSKVCWRKLTLKSAVLGLSGGIDSAITATLAQKGIWENQKRKELPMPSQCLPAIL